MASYMRPLDKLPGISDPNVALVAAHAWDGDLTGLLDGVNIRDTIFFHRLAYASAGTTAQFQFFNAAESRGVCNLAGGSNGLPSDYIFILEGIGFHVDPVFSDANETKNATFPYAAGAATAGTVAANVVAMLNAGIVNARVGDMELIREVRGLGNFPSSRGAVGTVNSLAADTWGNVVNGNPHSAVRGFRFTYPKFVLPGKPIRVNVDFPNVVALGVAGFLECQLFGQLVTPGAGL